MKYKFYDVVVKSKETPFTESEKSLSFELLGKQNQKDIIEHEDLFKFISQLLGEPRDVKAFSKKSTIHYEKLDCFINRVDELARNVSINVESISFDVTTSQEYESKLENNGRFCLEISGTLTLNGISTEETEKMRTSGAAASINKGAAMFLGLN